jgi:phosphatidylethanolamine-binding protein
MNDILTDLGINTAVPTGFSAPWPEFAGKELTPTESCSAPFGAALSCGSADKKYCMIMTDPDAPSREEPAYREFLHWMVSDITNTFTVNLDYCGPGPPCNSGLHRYIFLIYEQPDGADIAGLAAKFEGRGGKKAHTLAQEHGLGQLVLIDWYEAQWDESVDAVHEALNFMPPEKYRSPKQQAANA